ncbi:hypothetical protein GOBAR_DD11773 [Gossypium barbadense]|nr:hypothetical protein GOBAR_DD11773 [Gossypium barbadense]
MLEATKPFMSAFRASQGTGAIQWSARSSNSPEGEDNEREVESTRGNEEVEATMMRRQRVMERCLEMRLWKTSLHLHVMYLRRATLKDYMTYRASTRR